MSDTPQKWPLKRALLSVYNKTGVVELAKVLHRHQVELLSTGGTARLLKEHNLPVTDVSDYTGFPELMDGRVKTLHPKIHGGLLARRDQDQNILAQHAIHPIDLVICNLYPFTQVVADPSADFATAIENIDIGGPTMIRAAAKNHRWVTVVVNPEDYARLSQELEQHAGHTTLATRQYYAACAFAHTAAYDAAIDGYLQTALGPTVSTETPLPETLSLTLSHPQHLRYGENPHQRAALYQDHSTEAGRLATATRHQGKPLSYNNLADADTAWRAVQQLSHDAPACVIVKHANPCGVAQQASLLAAYQAAYRCDSTSAFGGILAFNRALDGDTAQAILAQQFVEVIIAPSFEARALTALQQKPNVRVLAVGEPHLAPSQPLQYLRIDGGTLVQDCDAVSDQHFDHVVTRQAPTAAQLADLHFAWRVCQSVKSNAIVYAHNLTTLGIGAGQMSRIDSAQIAQFKAQNAGLSLTGSVMASDAFFPFPDSIETAAKAGIQAIIQPGGSLRDEAVIAAADAAGISMVMTGMRHFRH